LHKTPTETNKVNPENSQQKIEQLIAKGVKHHFNGIRTRI
jgi:N-acetylmuramoyl-L-alanine amidase